MLEPNAVASPASYTILILGVLSIGFMIVFLIALVIDGKKTRVRHPAHCKEMYRQTDVTDQQPLASQLAIGVVRLTTALTSKPSLETRGATLSISRLAR